MRILQARQRRKEQNTADEGVRVHISSSYLLCRFTSLDVVAVYAVIQFSDALKAGVGLSLVASGTWARTVIERKQRPAVE